MGREEERAKKKREKNPIIECNNIQRKYVPELFEMFGQVADPRNQSYITYTIKEVLGELYYKSICGISSMREMTRQFNDETAVENFYRFIIDEKILKSFLSHGRTVNELLEKLNPKELEDILHKINYTMIRRKTFNDARINGKLIVLVDGTELDEGYCCKNEHYLSRTYNKGKETEFVKYHRSVLEAKLYYGNDIVCSIGTETIENSEEYINKSSDEVKQDCEMKAFKRLAKKIKKKFPRLPIVIIADSLYVTDDVMNICEDNGWDYIIRYKEGRASSIAKEYSALPEKKYVETDIEYQNEIPYQKHDVNLIYYTERKLEKKEEIITEYAWVTSMKITKNNARKIVTAGRNRWKIENQGFNRQKHWQGNIEHACSWNERAQKNHYLMEQIADFIKQLYEYFFLKKNEIIKLQKNISSELLASFIRQLTKTEDTNQTLEKNIFQ